MNKFLLWLIMLPSALWHTLGADLHQLRAILHVKLLMDDRTPVQIGRSSQKKKGKAYGILQVFIYFIIGFIYTFPMWFMQTDLLFGLTGYYTFFLFFLCFTLIIGFSTVLIDTRDNLVLLPRPINERTLLLARLLHVVIYLFRMVIPMALPGWIIMGYLKGWIGVAFFIVPVVLLVFIALFLVNVVYLFIIRLAGPSRFKDVLSSFQIVFSIILFASYYLLPRMMDAERLQTMHITDISWARVLPSYWLAAMWTWFYNTAYMLPGTFTLSLLSLVVPFITMWIAVRWLAPKFVHALSGGEGAAPKKKVVISGGKAKTPFYRKLSVLLNKNKEAQAGFELTWVQTARNRAYKMKVYPSLAYIPIYFVYIFFSKGNVDYNTIWERMATSKIHLVLLYMGTFALMQAVLHIVYSEQYKASWVYFATPVERPGNILSGAFKAAFVKYYMPFILVISAFVIAVTGWKSILDIIISQVNVLIFILLMARVGVKAFPFSLKEQMKERAGKNVMLMMLVFLAVPLLGLAHYLAVKYWMLKFIIYPLTLILFWLLWDGYKKTSWTAILHPELD